MAKYQMVKFVMPTHIIAEEERALVVSLKHELLVALDQCRLHFCSQEESLVNLQNQIVQVVGGCCHGQEILSHFFVQGVWLKSSVLAPSLTTARLIPWPSLNASSIPS